MANRHKMSCKATGGTVYAGAGSNVIKEAKQKAAGGAVYDGKGSNTAKEAEEKADGGKVEGKKSAPRLDKRARGGGVNATKSPFSSAAGKGGGSNNHPFSSAKTGK